MREKVAGRRRKQRDRLGKHCDHFVKLMGEK